MGKQQPNLKPEFCKTCIKALKSEIWGCKHKQRRKKMLPPIFRRNRDFDQKKIIKIRFCAFWVHINKKNWENFSFGYMQTYSIILVSNAFLVFLVWINAERWTISLRRGVKTRDHLVSLALTPPPLSTFSKKEGGGG